MLGSDKAGQEDPLEEERLPLPALRLGVQPSGLKGEDGGNLQVGTPW